MEVIQVPWIVYVDILQNIAIVRFKVGQSNEPIDFAMEFLGAG